MENVALDSFDPWGCCRHGTVDFRKKCLQGFEKTS